LGGLLNFGVKRGYCAENPCKRLDTTRREAVEIEIYSPKEVARIFSVAEKGDTQVVPFLAISFFCGVRRAEALRLDWSAIDLHENFLKLPAAITKTRQPRYIEISDNCKAWLASHAVDNGAIVPFTTDVLRKRLGALKAIHKILTIKHGMRHSFASYWLAKHGDINQLCLFLGHDDPETTFRHYAKAATKRDAEKFWAIMPKTSVPKNVVTFQRQRAAAL
jgi:integrase